MSDENQTEEHTPAQQQKSAIEGGNWKKDLPFSKKLAPLPAKGWKKDFDQFALKQTEKKPKAEKAPPKPLQRKTPLPRPTKPIAQIGKKKKLRILEEGSEVDLFRGIWMDRLHFCEECGEEIKGAFLGKSLIKPQCFSHKLPKGMYPKFRLLPENIDLVCSMECHNKNAKSYEDLETRYNMEIEFTALLKEK